MTSIVATVVLTAAMVADATGGRVIAGPASAIFTGVTIDTRTMAPGALFVALRGDRFDGHDFIDSAVARGAAGVLVSRRPASAGEAAVILVPDTLTALQQLGRRIRRDSQARVVAITGSAGKTTTKEMTADLLSARYRVFRNAGNFNNHIGLPLSLAELRLGPDIAVVELGMNHAGEIRTLVALAEPEVRVWTNVGDAHIGYFGSREAIARAKAEILEGASADTVLVANADDALVMSHAAGFAGRLRLFGEQAAAHVRAVRVDDHGFDGWTADVSTPAGTIHLDATLPGRVHLANVLAAIAVAIEFDVTPAEIEARAAMLRPVARRGAAVTLPSGVRLVDDSYNASPAATAAMLAALAATPAPGRRIAVLGEMLELGESAPALHEAAGRAAAAARIDLLVAVGGPDADGLIDGARAGGMRADQLYRYAGSAAAAEAVAALVATGDLVLVKGSRGTRTDLVADRLRGEA